MRRPYVPIYKGDWKNDPALQCCSLAAQAVWLLMLMSIDDSPHPGFLLKANGLPPSDHDLGLMLGRPSSEVLPLVGELGDNKVFARVTAEDAERGFISVKLPRGKSYNIPVSKELIGCVYSRRRLRECALALAKARRSGANVEQTSLQTLDRSNSRSTSNSNSTSIGNIDPSAARAREAEPDSEVAFQSARTAWVRSGLEQIPTFDDKERSAFYVNFFLPRQKKGLSADAIVEDARLFVDKVNASSIYKQRSFHSIMSKPADLARIMSGDLKDWSRVGKTKKSPEEILAEPMRGGGSGLRARAEAMRELREQSGDGPVIDVFQIGPGGEE